MIIKQNRIYLSMLLLFAILLVVLIIYTSINSEKYFPEPVLARVFLIIIAIILSPVILIMVLNLRLPYVIKFEDNSLVYNHIRKKGVRIMYSNIEYAKISENRKSIEMKLKSEHNELNSDKVFILKDYIKGKAQDVIDMINMRLVSH